MAGVLVASVIVNELVSKLSSELWSELGLLWYFNNDLQYMKTTLKSIEAVLNHAEKLSFNDEPVRLWLKRLKAAAYDIEDMLDEFPTHNRLLYSPIMAYKLKVMRERLDKIAEERSRYNLIKEEVITYQQQITEDRETYSTVNGGNVLGREGEAMKIINMLLCTTSDTTSIVLIPIVGLGGLGKTTLAKLIFNDDKIKKDFEPRIWVYAADFNVEKLTEAILSSARTGNGNRLTTLESKTKGAKEILNGKKFLMVLDDVWNEDGEKWEAFKEILQGGKKESKIIVTTRSERVSSIMDATKTQQKLKPLSDDVCLELFKRRAFGSADTKDINLVLIGKEIVKKCQGVPLAANSLGGMLHFERGEAAWEKVRDSDLWELKEQEGSGSSSENKVIPSLKLSYQHMPSPLKLCFVYCSSYPRAFKLQKGVLIQQWIAQRFIRVKDEIEALQIGDGYINYLLSLSFLEEEEEILDFNHFFDKNSRVTYKMHDLVYDLARWVAGDEVSVLDALESGKHNVMECRYASVIESNGQSKELGKALPRKVRVLHFHEFTSLPTGIFSYTECLRVLDFTGSSLDELPTSIYRLKQLRYLRLPDHLDEVDEQIGNIRTLGSLIISNSRSLYTLPTSMGKLHNLIYLEISYVTELSEIPYSIGNLQKLNNLKIVSCYMLKSLPESLGNLINLVTLKIRNCNSLESLPRSLGNLMKLERLTIYDCRAIRSLPESLSNLVNLKILAIGKLSNVTLSVSIGKLHNLIDLDLSFFDELLELPDSIARLQKLNSLRLYGCYNLGSLPESLGNLKELITLDIRMCATLPDELPQDICNMRHLKIQRDELLEFDTSELHLHLVDGSPEEHVVRDVTDAKRINLKERGGTIKSLSYHCGYKKGRAAEAMLLEALQPHQNLQELCIDSYSGLMFPSWMMRQMESFLPNLVKITLTRITNCEHLPVLGQLPKLEEIVIDYMGKLRRINEEELCGARNTIAGASFPSLKRLKLSRMWKLEHLPVLGQLPKLEEIVIYDMAKIRRISEEELCGARNTTAGASFPSLKRLKLLCMPDLEEWVTAATAGDDGERGAFLFPCLEHLAISDCFKLRRVQPRIPPSVRRLSLTGNDLHHLTFLDVPEMPLLKHLDIFGPNLDSFPESIRCLTSLETLELKCCKSLTTLPERLGERLTPLKRLCITGCSERLLERTRKETGEDWDKISRIDNIEITRDLNEKTSIIIG